MGGMALDTGGVPIGPRGGEGPLALPCGPIPSIGALAPA